MGFRRWIKLTFKKSVFWAWCGLSIESTGNSNRVLEEIQTKIPSLNPNSSPSSTAHCKKNGEYVEFLPSIVTCLDGANCTLEGQNGKVILKLLGVEAPRLQDPFGNGAKAFSENFLLQKSIILYAQGTFGVTSLGDACTQGRYLREELLSKGLAYVNQPLPDKSKTTVVIGEQGPNGGTVLNILPHTLLRTEELKKLFEWEDKARNSKMGVWSVTGKQSPQSAKGDPARARSSHFPLLVEPQNSQP